MPTPVANKLKIKAGYSLVTLHAPATFQKQLGKLPAGVEISDDIRHEPIHQLHWFVSNRAQLEKELGKVMKLVHPGLTIWVYYPKGSSKIQTDLTRDKGWDSLLAKGDELTWISLVSFDDTWSVFGFRQKNDTDRKKEAAPAKPKEIDDWIDREKKIVHTPPDLEALLKKNKKAAAYYDQLAFSHRKEWVEWIVTAKKPETRSKRVKETVERLAGSWKNPSDR